MGFTFEFVRFFSKLILGSQHIHCINMPKLEAWHCVSLLETIVIHKNLLQLSIPSIFHRFFSFFVHFSLILENSIADFVIFPPRWSVQEHTFRPPYFHRKFHELFYPSSNVFYIFFSRHNLYFFR